MHPTHACSKCIYKNPSSANHNIPQQFLLPLNKLYYACTYWFLANWSDNLLLVRVENHFLKGGILVSTYGSRNSMVVVEFNG